jgi:splicing factor 3B subunit 1
LERDVLTEEELLKTIVPEFFGKFWIRRTALGSRSVHTALLAAVDLLARRVGATPLLRHLVPILRDESAPFRMLALAATATVADSVSLDGLPAQLLKELVDGAHYTFQSEDLVDSNATVTPATRHLAAVLVGLGLTARPFLPEICGDLKWRLNNKDPKVRQQAASLIARIAPLVDDCEEQGLLVHLGTVLYERLGEEYPDVLGAVLSGLTEILAQLPLEQVQPSVSDVILRLTPIMKNQHMAVQSTAIVLIGELARRGPEYVAAREWMRISFELLDFLSARRKATRKAAVATFGHISAAIGPQDVLATLLNNLRVTDRQQRVCTTVAIAIVAESCGPFTVLPALINEYRVPDAYVQNGVIKSLTFMLQFIGGSAMTYLDAIVPVLADALTDRDHVHRQTAASAVKHLAFSVRSRGADDLLIHLLNCLWPNVLETTPHVIDRVHAAIDSLTLALGPDILMLYLIQGLFHPAKRVRLAFWKVYENMRAVDKDGVTRSAIELDSAYKSPDREAGGDPALFRRHELTIML